MFKRMLRAVPAPATPLESGGKAMFKKILHANDGSEPAFKALALALAVAAQNNAELHMVCVEEVSYLPEFAEEVRQEVGTAARRFHGVLQRACALAEPQLAKFHTHVVGGGARGGVVVKI